MPTLLAWMALHLGVGVVGTWLARRYALRRNLIDQPGERRSHRNATPRGGGISIVAAMLLGMGLLAINSAGQAAALALAGGGLVLVAGIGWIDDHRPLSPWLRLAVHGLAALLLAASVLVAGLGLHAAVVALGAAVVLVNVWNFMDGIDGLAATQAAIVAACYALLAGGGPVFWLGLGLAAAACGFLPFNLPKARIFLGDVGSGALGYLLAGLLAASSTWTNPSDILSLLPLSVFLIDATMTLFSRMLRGEQWWMPHVQHAYQRWARVIGRHPPVTLAYALAGMAVAALTAVIRSCGIVPVIVIMAGCWLAGGLAWLKLQAVARARGNGVLS